MHGSDILTELSPVFAILAKVTLVLALGWAAHLSLLSANPRWRVLLWRSLAVGVLALPVAEFMLPDLTWPVLSEPAPSVVIEKSGGLSSAPVQVDIASNVSWPPARRGEKGVSPVRLSPSAWIHGNGTALLLSVWALFTTFFAIRITSHVRKLRRCIRNTVRAPDSLRAFSQRIAVDLRCTTDVDLRVTSMPISPFLAGIMHPVLVLPESVTKTQNTDQLRAILAHELVHLKSNDQIWVFLLKCLSTLLWFHPLMWRLPAAHRASCEQVSDTVAAKYVGGVSVYAPTLAKTALEVLAYGSKLGAAPMIGTAEITQRLHMLRRGVQAAALSRGRAAGLLAMGCCVLVALGSLKLASASEAKNQIIAAIESNLSRIEDVSLEYQATTTNKGGKEPLFVTQYMWAMKHDSERLSWSGYPTPGTSTTDIRSGPARTVVYEAHGVPRKIAIFPDSDNELDYSHGNISGFLFNGLPAQRFLKTLQSGDATFKVHGQKGIIRLVDRPREKTETLEVDLEKGLVVRRTTTSTADGRTLATFIVQGTSKVGGAWFMTQGTLHRWANKRGTTDKLHTENTQDVFVEIGNLSLNAGLSDSLFAVSPRPGDEAGELLDGVWVDYFQARENKQERVARITQKRDSRRKFFDAMRDKPAPSLQIRKWINREPRAAGKRRVYLFWDQSCLPSVVLLRAYDRQYRVLSEHVEVVAIHDAKGADTLEQFLRDNRITIPVGVDDAGKTYAQYVPDDGWPHSFLIDKEGAFSTDMRGTLFLGNVVRVPVKLEEAYLEAVMANHLDKSENPAPGSSSRQ